MMSEEPNQSVEARDKIRERVYRVLETASFRDSGDVKITITGRDRFSVSMDVHRRVLADKSRFFAERFGGGDTPGVEHTVEICDCDDVAVNVESLVLMYSDDVRRRLMGEDVSMCLGCRVRRGDRWKGGFRNLLDAGGGRGRLLQAVKILDEEIYDGGGESSFQDKSRWLWLSLVVAGSPDGDGGGWRCWFRRKQWRSEW